MAKYTCCYEQPRDFSAIHSRIAERHEHEYLFAAELGITKQSLSRKLNSIEPFTVSDICTICELLDIPESEIDAYFRTPLVKQEETRSLRTVIKEKFGTEAALARATGIPKNTLGHRLNFEIDFRYTELLKIAEALEISISELVELLEIERRKQLERT